MTTSILLVDDQPLLRMGFRMVLESQDDLLVVGEAGDGAEALALTAELDPDIVLMDVRMPGMDGIEATRRIVGQKLRSRVIILTTFDLDEYAFGALRAGASGFLLKDVRPAELVHAIRTVSSGDAVVSPGSPAAHGKPLPPAREAYRAGAGCPRGAGPRPVQQRDRSHLLVSETTVKSHVGRILAKLGPGDRVQIVVLAYEAGLVRPGTSG
jgi:DNA-binding NarL/FixJ family response regulator